jgi:hypothetical protein
MPTWFSAAWPQAEVAISRSEELLSQALSCQSQYLELAFFVSLERVLYCLHDQGAKSVEYRLN